MNRDVARKLTREEINNWKGPLRYISHLAVVNLSHSQLQLGLYLTQVKYSKESHLTPISPKVQTVT